MDDMDPYTGYDGYGPGMGEDDVYGGNYQTSNNPSAAPAANVDSPPLLTARTFDSRRSDEIDILNDSYSSLDTYTTPRAGYGEIPLIASYADSSRVSIHPLGITSKPPGIAESLWKDLKGNKLITPNYDPSSIGEEEYVLDTGEEEQQRSQQVVVTKPKAEEVEKSEGEHDPTEMPFLDHLEEFRWSLLKSIFVLAITTIGSWFLSDMFYKTITNLTNKAEIKMQATRLFEPIFIKVQMALVMGLVISLPFIFYFLWSFVSPGLYQKEKKWILPLVYGASVCFFIGAAIAYFLVIPMGFIFLKNYLPEDILYIPTVSNVIGTVLKFIILFGVLFEMPLVSFFLAKIGVLKYTWMVYYRRYAIVIIFIIGAVLTPPDPVTQIMMALPLVLLYEISIIVARIAGKKTLI